MMAGPAQIAYKYTPLPSPRHIRLLQILSGRGEPTRCRLNAFDLEKDPEYQCLSYTWSDPIDHALSPGPVRAMSDKLKHPITHQDGSIIYVAENCLGALQRLSGSDQTYLWIDAICINQEDIIERGQQVDMMTSIYQKARNVIIWLGPQDSRTEGALKVMDRLKSASMPSLGSAKPSYDIDGYGYDILRAWGAEHGIYDLGEQEWLDFAALLHRKWFGRVWVIQESYFAKQRTVLLGEYSLDWIDIVRSVQFLSRAGLETVLKAMYLRAEQGPGYPIDKMTMSVPNNRLDNLQVFENLARSKTLRMEQCLHYTRFFEATNKRDHVFSMHGLLKAGMTSEFAAELVTNYTATVEDVYTKATVIAIRESRSLQILGLRDCISDEVWPHLSSWVPVYGHGVRVDPLLDEFSVNRKPAKWNASGSLSWHDLGKMDIRNILPASGFEFDIVVETGPTFDEVDTRFNVQSLLHMLYGYNSLEYVAGGSVCAALQRTLVKDAYEDTHEGSDVGAGFAAFVMQRLRELREQLHKVEYFGEDDESYSLYAQALRERLKDTEGLINHLSSRHTDIPTLSQIDDMIRVAEDDGSAAEHQLDMQRQNYEQSFRVAYFGRRLFRTRKGYLGITAETVTPDDRLWILAGAKLLFVLKQQGTTAYRMVGEAYVHGVMYGEAVTPDVQLQRLYLQ